MTGNSGELLFYNRTKSGLILTIMLLGCLAWSEPIVEIEEIITPFTPANNGAGPLWCY